MPMRPTFRNGLKFTYSVDGRWVRTVQPIADVSYPSSSSDNRYKVKLWDDDLPTCECRGWIHRRDVVAPMCRHTLDARTRFPIPQENLTASWRQQLRMRIAQWEVQALQDPLHEQRRANQARRMTRQRPTALARIQQQIVAQDRGRLERLAQQRETIAGSRDYLVTRGPEGTYRFTSKKNVPREPESKPLPKRKIVLD